MAANLPRKKAAPGSKSARGAYQAEVEVCVGSAELPVGRLVYVKDGAREFSRFTYFESWLTDARSFDISPDLSRIIGYQLRRPPTKNDTAFFLAIGDTEPDTWGRRVIARAHAKERKKDPTLAALSELDYLCAVDDFSRVGALRLRDGNKVCLRSVEEGKRATPPLLELEKMLAASRAVEMGNETADDLRYLQGKGTSLGGARPKCSILDDDGSLALGKFPSVNDERSVVRAEVLALRLADRAGIETAQARVVMVQGRPVAVIRRFDRTATQARIPYMSGATLLQADRDVERAYTEVVDQMAVRCANFADDARQLWRRLTFNFLITNVDDHLQNIGFLYATNNQWRLAPAFDLNPFPDKDRESKTWLSEDTGPITSIAQLLGQAARFALSADQALATLKDVVHAVSQWRAVATLADVGMSVAELDDFEPAFEHHDFHEAMSLVA
jgi:serine/threonine-protein kinase HipA